MKTDWKDEIFAQRKFEMKNNGDGTVTPIDKTVYTQQGDVLGAKELNEIGNELNALETEMASVKKSVSDGKTLIAAAITAKKVTTAATATFAQMAANIKKIILGSGNATASDVLAGKTFTNDDGVQYTGTMVDRGAVSQSLNAGGSYTISAGRHNGSGKVTANSLASQTSGTAGAGHILSGQTAWVNGNKITGTIASRGAATITPGTANQVISAGQYLSGAQTIKGDANLLAGNILNGKSIFGVAGNVRKYAYATGNAVSSASRDINAEMYKVSISLGFTPMVGYVMYYASENRDITVYAPNTGVGKAYDVVNFNQVKRWGFNSWGDNNGMHGIVIGPNMILPVAYGNVVYSYWFAGYY